MPPPKPRPTREALEHQDQSIKDRKSQLFDDAAGDAAGAGGEVRPFAEYLRTTPADPLSPGWKAILWALAVVVGLLLVASLIKGARGRRAARPPASTPATSAGPQPAAVVAAVGPDRDGASP